MSSFLHNVLLPRELDTDASADEVRCRVRRRAVMRVVPIVVLTILGLLSEMRPAEAAGADATANAPVTAER